jgi:uncharacterized Tic20 family protein
MHEGAVLEITEAVTATPTQDERTFAVLAHALQVVGWWIAPLIIFVIKRPSKFVAFHSLQVLLFQTAYAISFLLSIAIFFAVMISTVMSNHSGPPNAPPPAMFIVFPVFWLFMMGGWVVMIVLVIVYSIKAGRGEWAEYPLLGRLARRILKLAPDGTSISN